MKKKNRKFHFKITQRLAVSGLLVCFVATFILSLQYYHYSRGLFEEQTEKYISSLVKQTGENLDIHIKEFQDLIFNIQKEPRVQNYLIDRKENVEDSYTGYTAQKEIDETIYNYILFEDAVEAIKLFAEDGTGKLITKTLKEYNVDPSWKGKIDNGLGGPVWLGLNSEKDCIVVGAQINSIKTMKPLGYMILYISEDIFKDIYSKNEYVKDGYIFIADDNLNIVSSNHEEQLGDKLSTNMAGLIEVAGKSHFEKIKEQKESKYVMYTILENKEWYLFFTIPTVRYSDTIYELRRYIAIIFAVAIGGMLVLNLVNAYSFSKPIKKLLQAMQEFGDGDFNVICSVNTSDEIGALYQRFNMMVYNINDLIDKVYTETMLKQEAELRSLRMQINPHFLYNTLETINWISREKGIEEVGVIAKSLGDMMRYTINGSDFTFVADEIQNIHNYLNIQRTRYRDRIQFSVDIPEELYDYKLPKLILQPIIENAIVHGVENKRSEGKISIRGKIENQQLNFSITDNGAGIEKELLEKILLENGEETEGNHKSIGVANVNQRLKLYYGGQRGLVIHSIVNVGTEVVVRIPVGRDSGPEKLLENNNSNINIQNNE